MTSEMGTGVPRWMRALDGTRNLITEAPAVEFAVLGAFAGVVAVLGVGVAMFALRARVFGLGYEIRPRPWIAGPAVGMALIAGIGYLGTRKLFRSPPLLVLRVVSIARARLGPLPA